MLEIKKVNQEEAENIINKRKPQGLFYLKDNNVFVGIDNTEGNAWIEEFKTQKECLSWLIGDYDGN